MRKGPLTLGTGAGTLGCRAETGLKSEEETGAGPAGRFRVQGKL